MTQPSPLRAVLALALAGASAGVFAQAFDAVRLYGAAPDKDGGLVGLALVYGRAYPGAEEHRTRVFPSIDYQWRNGWFAGVTNGIGYNFSGTPGIQYGLRVTADLGRDESRSPALAGLGDIDARPEFGGFFNYHLSREFFVSSSLRGGSGNDRKGVVLDLGAGYSTPLSDTLRLGAGVGLSVVNQKYMQSSFGIDATQSANSGYAVYTPSAGLRDVRINTSLTYRVTERIGITGAVSLSSLQGDAKDSPIVRRRSSANGVLAVSYAF
jgi:outer membrane scaffolding protein for murein synthesis (MipA/OmpV family)